MIRETIIAIVDKAKKPIASYAISEALGIAPNDKSARSRVSYFLSTLKKSRTLIHANGTYSTRSKTPRSKTPAPKTPAPKTAAPKTLSPDRITREQVTEEVVLDIIKRMGQANSSQISETLGIPTHDGSLRNKVSVILGFLRDANQIVPIGEAEKTTVGCHTLL